MSWHKRIILVISLSTLAIFTLTLALNWLQGPGIANLVGQVKSSDLFQHYVAGKIVSEQAVIDFSQNVEMGNWVLTQIPFKKDALSTPFNYVYPPLVAWITAPFTQVSYLTYALGWLGLSILFYLISTKQLLTITASPQLLYGLLLLLGLPTFHYTLILGQNSTLTFFIICSAATLLYRKQEIAAGIVLSFLFYKPQFIPPLLAFMLLQGHWRFVLSCCLASAIWLAMGLLICGIHTYLDWLQIVQNLNKGDFFQVTTLNQTLKMFILNLLGQASNPTPVAGFLTTLLGATIFAGTALSLRYLTLKPFKKWTPAHSLFFAAALMTITSPYLMHYDLLLAAGWALLCFLEDETSSLPSLLLWSLFWVASLFSINMLDWITPITAPLMLIYLAGTLSFYFKFSISSVSTGLKKDWHAIKTIFLGYLKPAPQQP